MKVKIKVASLIGCICLAGACLLGSKCLAATSNIENADSSTSSVVTIDSAIKDLNEGLDSGNEVLRADGSKTDDFLNINLSNLFHGSGFNQVPCGLWKKSDEVDSDRNIHICLFASKENSAFDGDLKGLLLEVVRDEDGQVVFQKPCELEEINDNVYLDLSSETVRSHLSDSKKKNDCFCNDFVLKATDIIKNKYSRKLKFSLSDDEVKQGAKFDSIGVEKFLTLEDFESLSNGVVDVRKFEKSNKKNYTLKFYRVNGDDKNLVAKSSYKFIIFN